MILWSNIYFKELNFRVLFLFEGGIMNRHEFIRKYAQKTHTKIYKTEEFLSNLEKLIIELISSGETINLHGFCEIGVKNVKDKIGTNPQNSELMTIKGGKRVYMKPCARLKSAAKSIEL